MTECVRVAVSGNTELQVFDIKHCFDEARVEKSVTEHIYMAYRQGFHQVQK